MNRKAKTIILALALAVFIAAAFFVSDFLSGKVGTEGNLAVPPLPGQTEAPVPPASPPEQKEPANPSDGQDITDETEDGRIPAPDFTVLDAEGAEVKLSELFGKPIVLNFWASWCPPCKSEMPEFNKVYAELGTDVIFMMVNLVDGQRETIESGAKFIADQGYAFPVYFDNKGEAGNTYVISSIPTTFFIDKDGYIITGAQGAIDEKTLRKGIEYITSE